MRAIDYQSSPPLSVNKHIQFKSNMRQQALTVSSIAELVDLTGSKVFTSEEKQENLDLSFEAAKLAAAGDEILEAIKSIKDKFENYTPLYEIRKRLTHLSREEQDKAIQFLSRIDIIELSTLNEPINYTEEQLKAGIPTKIGTYLFFVILN